MLFIVGAHTLKKLCSYTIVRHWQKLKMRGNPKPKIEMTLSRMSNHRLTIEPLLRILNNQHLAMDS
jgi:hypothetical protein